MTWKSFRAGLIQYSWNVLIAIDQLANALAGGDPDETISSRLGKAHLRGTKYGHWLWHILEYIQPGHCTKAIERDEGRREVKWE